MIWKTLTLSSLIAASMLLVPSVQASDTGMDHHHGHGDDAATDAGMPHESGTTQETMPHSSDGMSHGEDMAHEHGTLEISDTEPAPTVELVAYEDDVDGWNLEARVNNFAFAPESVNKSSKQSEGHAHLYINGEKVTRLYGPWYYLSALEPGRYEVTVTLNTNGHEDLTENGEVISDSLILEVPDISASQ